MNDIKNERRKRTRLMLWRWGNTINDISRLEQEREAFRRWANDAAETLHAQNMDGMPHGTGKTSDLSDVVVTVIERQKMYQEYADKIDKEITERVRIKTVIDEHIRELHPVQEKIISYRYIDGHGWQYIAMRTGYDERQARRIEAKAVDFISQFVL